MANEQRLTAPTNIPPEFAGMVGVATGHAIKPWGQCRTVLMSRPKRGKSTLIHGCPTMAVLDTEDGGSQVRYPRCLRYGSSRNPDGTVFSPTITDFRKFIDKLIELRIKGKSPFTTVAIDTVNSWVATWGREFCRRKNVSDFSEFESHKENPWTMQASALMSMLEDVRSAGMGWCAITHVAPKALRTKEGERMIYSIALANSMIGPLLGAAEHILFLDTKEVPNVVQKKVGDKMLDIPSGTKTVRVVESSPPPAGEFKAWQAEEVGSRVPLPREIEISAEAGWSDLEAAYNKAVESLSQCTG